MKCHICQGDTKNGGHGTDSDENEAFHYLNDISNARNEIMYEGRPKTERFPSNERLLAANKAVIEMYYDITNDPRISDHVKELFMEHFREELYFIKLP